MGAFFDTYDLRPRRRKPKLSKRLDRKFALVFVPLSLALVGVWVLLAARATRTRSNPDPSPARDVLAEDGEVRIASPEVGDRTARFFRYHSSTNRAVRFFVARGRDDRVRSALDACGVAYARGRGFRQVGCDVACNSCGRAFCIDHVGKQIRACQPVNVPHRLSDGYVVIAARELDSASRYFPP